MIDTLRQATPRCNGDGVYEPTHEEIAAACAEIQSEWDERTEQMRRVVRNPAVETQVCSGRAPRRGTQND